MISLSLLAILAITAARAFDDFGMNDYVGEAETVGGYGEAYVPEPFDEEAFEEEYPEQYADRYVDTLEEGEYVAPEIEYEGEAAEYSENDYVGEEFDEETFQQEYPPEEYGIEYVGEYVDTYDDAVPQDEENDYFAEDLYEYGEEYPQEYPQEYAEGDGVAQETGEWEYEYVEPEIEYGFEEEFVPEEEFVEDTYEDGGEYAYVEDAPVGDVAEYGIEEEDAYVDGYVADDTSIGEYGADTNDLANEYGSEYGYEDQGQGQGQDEYFEEEYVPEDFHENDDAVQDDLGTDTDTLGGAEQADQADQAGQDEGGEEIVAFEEGVLDGANAMAIGASQKRNRASKGFAFKFAGKHAKMALAWILALTAAFYLLSVLRHECTRWSAKLGESGIGEAAPLLSTPSDGEKLHENYFSV